MAKQFDNNNSGALFKNDRKQTENHPDYTGSAEVKGTEYWLSAWLKKSKAGKTYMSLSFTPKEEQAATSSTPEFEPVTEEDIPF